MAGHNKKILSSFVCAGYANGKRDSCEVSFVRTREYSKFCRKGRGWSSIFHLHTLLENWEYKSLEIAKWHLCSLSMLESLRLSQKYYD